MLNSALSEALCLLPLEPGLVIAVCIHYSRYKIPTRLPMAGYSAYPAIIIIIIDIK